jgi:hypothetical protein
MHFTRTLAILVVLVHSAACGGQEAVRAPERASSPPVPLAGASSSPMAASAPAKADAGQRPHARLQIESLVSFDVILSYEDGTTVPISVAQGHNEFAIPAGKMLWDRSWSGDCQYGPPGAPYELDADLHADETIRLRCSPSGTLQNNMGLCCEPE